MNNLLRLVGRRLVALPIMALGVTFLVFFLMSFSPIDPAYKALGEAATPEAIQKYHEDFGLDDPWPVRYVRYMGDLLHGNLGTYSAQRRPVSDSITTALPVVMVTSEGLLTYQNGGEHRKFTAKEQWGFPLRIFSKGI